MLIFSVSENMLYNYEAVYDGKLKGAETPTVELCCYWFHINIFGPFSLRSPAIYLYNLYNTTKMPTNSFKLDFLHHLGNEEKNIPFPVNFNEYLQNTRFR